MDEVRASGILEVNMKISPAFVGMKLRELDVEVTPRATMNYAAGVGDANPAYFDDNRKGGIIAPPLFAESLTWKISGRIWEFVEDKNFPTEVLMTQVHYSERLEFHRPVVSGEKLKIKGCVAAIAPHRAGTHAVIKYVATGKDGAQAFTSYTGAMFRGVQCDGEAAGMENVPAAPAPPEACAAPVWSSAIHVDELAAHVYDGCADIHFPIHTSPRFATGVGLPGIILQGTATLALAAKEIVNREADGDPSRLKMISTMFSGMVFPGTDITITLESEKPAEDGAGRLLFFSVLNAAGDKALKKAVALVS